MQTISSAAYGNPAGTGPAHQAHSRPRERHRPATASVRLNPAQQQAVAADDERPLLIVAGPGSGKTHVLVARIARLIDEHRARASGILACAFTNRAANELRERLDRSIGRANAGAAQVSTMHTAAARLLRDVGQRYRYIGEFDIANNTERLRRLRDALFDARVDTSVVSAADAAARISYAKNVLADPGDPQTYAIPGEAPSERDRELAEVARLYARSLAQDGQLDFDDLLLRCLDMLESNEQAAAASRGRFTHVIVDEYQDTNEPQYRIIRHLTREHQRVTVVGDPDQAIYGWRGADVGKILQFRNDYPEALVVNLERNYRSTPEICKAASTLIAYAASGRSIEHKVVAADPAPGPPVEWAWFDRQADEAASVVDRFKRHTESDAGKTRAVLYRTNAQARAFETRLRRENIPYRIIGGVGFFERAEIRDAVAYLRVIDNPGDDEAMRRIANVPRRHLGRQTMKVVEQLRDDERRNGHRASTWSAMEAAVDRRLLKRWQERAICDFRALVERLGSRAHQLPVRDVIERMLGETGYLRMVSQMDDEVAEDKAANLAELIEDAHAWKAEHGAGAGSKLRAYIDECEAMGRQSADEDNDASTFLMTLHAAKGQEFDVVALSGCEEDVLPHRRSAEERPDGLAEERRLCYVGMTRAMRTLLLSGCGTRPRIGGGYRKLTPSRFIEELLAAEVVERVDRQ